MKNILVALDLNNSDSILIKHAASLAAKFHAKLWLIHIATPNPDFVGFETGPTYVRDTLAKELREEHRQLQKIMHDLEHKSFEVEALLIQGPTVEMLEQEVEKLEIDLLIMGSRRHGFIYETVVGHTSFKVVKQLSIPVMIVPLEEEG